MRLRDRPHGHVAAITPAGDAEAVGIDGQSPDHVIDAQQDVAQIALAEVLHVGFGEGFPAPEAAAGIREEHEIALARKQRHIERAGQAGFFAAAGPPCTETTMGYFFAGS